MIMTTQNIAGLTPDEKRLQQNLPPDLAAAHQEIERLKRQLDEALAFINGMSINAANMLRAMGVNK